MKPLFYASLAVAFCASLAGAYIASAVVRYANHEGQLALARRQLKDTEKTLTATLDELAKAKRMLVISKGILDDIVAEQAHRKSQQAAMRTASVVGIGTNFGTGPIAIGGYAIHAHRNQLNWCGPNEFGFP